MRWIMRGSVPVGVSGYAKQFTQGWVNHFKKGIGGRPNDHYWTQYRKDLGKHTHYICWYCERQCDCKAESGGLSPTVDHFRPISRCPSLAYDWNNWILSCRRCNEQNKQNKWPDTGYVDPCADQITERPENYFSYDEISGRIEPEDGLPPDELKKANSTIENLGLNKLDVWYYRFDWMRGFVADVMELPHSERRNFVSFILEQPSEFAGSAITVVQRLQRDGII